MRKEPLHVYVKTHGLIDESSNDHGEVTYRIAADISTGGRWRPCVLVWDGRMGAEQGNFDNLSFDELDRLLDEALKDDSPAGAHPVDKSA